MHTSFSSEILLMLLATGNGGNSILLIVSRKLSPVEIFTIGRTTAKQRKTTANEYKFNDHI